MKFRTIILKDYFLKSILNPGAFGLIEPQEQSGLSTLTEVFENGLEISRDKQFLGRRTVISTEPLTYGPYVWETYGEVDLRRRCIGSALFQMFAKGVLGGGDMETVGIWSQNRPGERRDCSEKSNDYLIRFRCRMADY